MATMKIFWFSWQPGGYFGCYDEMGSHKDTLDTMAIIEIFWFPWQLWHTLASIVIKTTWRYNSFHRNYGNNSVATVIMNSG